MGGSWRYKLIVSLELAKFTIQRYTNLWVDAGVTHLMVSLKLTKFTIQRYTNLWVDVGITRYTNLWDVGFTNI